MSKLAYVKPQITRIKLTIEEAVLTVCKTTAGGAGQGKNGACSTATTGACCKNLKGS